ncbi:MAG: MtrB/PioB family decaheme-associated outer membrane protein [Methylotenera sp.]|nr:MtrB/PioB family decaheme-associated outer membrane protein [Methylotenera sp.]
MKTGNEKMKVRILALAVQSALFAMFAFPLTTYAEDAANDEAAALKRPTNTVELGVTGVFDSSSKFGEYNGLKKSDPYGIGNFDIRGGNAYDGGDGTYRWGVKGVDLGTSSRTLGATVGNQGLWNLSVGYDELRHNNISDYKTPQQGSMGGNNFTFPANFGTINAAAAPSANSLNAIQLGAFHNGNVHTDRKNGSFSADYTFNPQFSFQFDFNHLEQSGAKLLGTGSLGGVNNPAGGTWRAEGNNIIMNPTNYTTDTVNLALNWIGNKGHLTLGYYGSFFQDGYDSVSSQNVFRNAAGFACNSPGPCSYQTTVMSTAPDNSLHQINLSGGYAFSSATKLVAGFSYGYNTQNNSYLSGLSEIASAAPRSSLNGEVITTHADLKLTHQATKDLGLSVGFKFNERDNRSPSNLYQFWAINSIIASATNKIDAAANAPYSNRKIQVEVAGDYRISKGQNVRLAYEHEDIFRWCNNYEVIGSNCLVNPSNIEDKLGVTYRLKAREDVNFTAGYTFAKRNAGFDGNAITPLAGLEVPTGGHDVNAQNYPGYIAYPYARRDQHLVKAGVNWQVTEKLDLGLNGRLTDDTYSATLGVQDGRTSSINLDASYAYTENGSISAYFSWQNSERNLKAGAAGIVPATANTATSYAALIAPTNIWTNQLEDDSNAIGINARQSGLLGGKLELIGDLSYSLDNSKYSTQAPYTSGATLCSLSTQLTCGSTPDIHSELISLRLSGNYQLNKHGKVVLGYLFQHLNSNDYYYNGLQYGYTPNRVMPTFEKSPNYSVNVVNLSYIHSF